MIPRNQGTPLRRPSCNPRRLLCSLGLGRSVSAVVHGGWDSAICLEIAACPGWMGRVPGGSGCPSSHFSFLGELRSPRVVTWNAERFEVYGLWTEVTPIHGCFACQSRSGTTVRLTLRSAPILPRNNGRLRPSAAAGPRGGGRGGGTGEPGALLRNEKGRATGKRRSQTFGLHSQAEQGQ